MEIAKVECLLRITQKGDINNLSVPKFGPDAVLVSEIPILRIINDIDEGGEDDCCVSEVRMVSMEETTARAEIDRLKTKYGQGVVNHVYPGGRGLPKTLEDCELPSSALAKKRAPAKKPEAA
jgi:hypothetical protein